MSEPATPVDLLRHVSRPRAGLNILFLCHRVPYPPDKGEKIRAFHMIRGLARRHKVHLLTLSDGAVPDMAPLEALCERVEVFPLSRPAAYLRAAFRALRPGPLTLSFFESPELAGRLRELARSERFDVMVVFCSAMAPYADLVPDVPAVLDMVDVDSAKWAQYARFAPLPLRPVYALEARRLRRYEASLAGRFQRVTFATGNETRLYKSFASSAGARAETVLSGVDFDFFQPMDLPKSPHPTLVFTGQMDYFANVDGVVHFARQVFPRLKQRFPDLEFVVVGRSPVPAVRDLGELPGIQVTGAVGDVRPFLARAWVFVAPLRIAQGVQNKVLEAMASNVPVVASERVLAGLSDGGFRNGRDLLSASSGEEMERAVATLIEDASARERLAESARQRLLATYRWAPNLERFEELVGASARPPAGSPLPSEDRRRDEEDGSLPLSAGAAGEARRA
ncbi:MAG TPA: TIGR03087 family PEP-CTERM/XrtA system glycosyltransferase [Thermoanaerobaculia bacterium]|jgi:sugar transferase (PEP-CTERM/EpsH1 system associated)|nr:TIGR03087 family PEP-CTERM/XrtA system glycosyltransferase [Thermoanaerobaculia bacterium]